MNLVKLMQRKRAAIKLRDEEQRELFKKLLCEHHIQFLQDDFDLEEEDENLRERPTHFFFYKDLLCHESDEVYLEKRGWNIMSLEDFRKSLLHLS